jgi:hypothetical protein
MLVAVLDGEYCKRASPSFPQPYLPYATFTSSLTRTWPSTTSCLKAQVSNRSKHRNLETLYSSIVPIDVIQTGTRVSKVYTRR